MYNATAGDCSGRLLTTFRMERAYGHALDSQLDGMFGFLLTFREGFLAMIVHTPHYFLFSEARPAPRGGRRKTRTGQWRFVLEAVDGSARLEAEDDEAETEENRLELLAVVRGLESLDQPSRVTVVTPSRYVSRGFRFGLEQWRENNWRWESYGEMTPIRNRDLWQRIDRAMRYHKVDCRTWRFDPAEHSVPAPKHAKLARRTRSRKQPSHEELETSPRHTVTGWCLERCGALLRRIGIRRAHLDAA